MRILASLIIVCALVFAACPAKGVNVNHEQPLDCSEVEPLYEALGKAVDWAIEREKALASDGNRWDMQVASGITMALIDTRQGLIIWEAKNCRDV